jgi:DNA-binding CsgD family transcriptional regulator
MAASILATLHVTDDPERCLAALDHAVLDPSWSARCALLRTRAALAAGRPDEAERHARAATTHPAAPAHTAATRAAAASTGRGRGPVAAMSGAASAGRGHALPLAAIRAEVARAEVLLMRGDAREAAARAEAAAEGRAVEAIVFNPPCALDAVEARLLQGRALAAAGDTERAKAVFQRVAAEAARGGAKRLMNAAARELRALGTRVSAFARRHEKGELSVREREIAELVAHGKSNKQVAAALYLSEKTVENALTRVYAKVGVRSRAQLARAWATG